MKTPFENRGTEAMEGRTVSTVTPAAAAQAGAPAAPAGLSQIETFIEELKGTNEALEYALLCARAAKFWIEVGKYDVADRVLDNGLAWLKHAKDHMNRTLGGESA
jgi:hypothetical protein